MSDHHAIIPTGASASLGGDEQKIYDLICRRLLSAWHDDYIWAVTTVITPVTSGPPDVEDRFHSTGTAVQQEGWKVLDIGGGKKRKAKAEDTGDDSADGGQTLPPGLEAGQQQAVEAVEPVEKKMPAQAIFRSYVAHGHGNGRQDAGRQRALRRDEGESRALRPRARL